MLSKVKFIDLDGITRPLTALITGQELKKVKKSEKKNLF